MLVFNEVRQFYVDLMVSLLPYGVRSTDADTTEYTPTAPNHMYSVPPNG